ncbi:MAG TPA: YdeI/OmpD-associated family protein [Pseudolysinimonas sp.]|nr:YdeI/OmpD-associated family protein [Pseudolysinimonas sp.]
MKNVETVTRKIEAGEMKPRGLAEVEKAKADGRWARAYAGSAGAEPHPDFLAALAANPAAQATYETLSAQNRFAIYFRLHQAKRPETVARNVEKFVAMLARGETFS